MKLFIKTITRGLIELELESWSTVLDVKEEILRSEKELGNRSTGNLRLWHNRKLLENDWFLQDLNLSENPTLDLSYWF